MKPLRLQTRVALASAIVITLGMLLCSVVTTLLARHEAFEELDHQLQAEARHFFEEWKRHGGAEHYDLNNKTDSIREWLPARHPQRLAQISRTNEEVIFRSRAGQSSLDGQPFGVRNIQIEGHPWRLSGINKDGIILRIAASLQPVRELTGKLILAFGAFLPLLIGLAALSGRWVARHALEPVRRITGVAERITAEQLDERVPVPAASDEIQRLAVVLNATFERLRKSFHQAKRFSADASHELKTPLTVLRASIESLLDSPRLEVSEQAAVASLLEQTRHLSSITESLLLLSHADAGRLKLDLAETDVSEIIEACAEDAKILSEDQGIRIEIDVPPSLRAAADAGRLSQILLNLFDNAIKYNHRGGQVKVTARASEHSLEIIVGNSGEAIPEGHAEHIFERFFRSAISSEMAGHGLGLSLSRELARAHGGDLILIKSKNNITEFSLSLPIA